MFFMVVLDGLSLLAMVLAKSTLLVSSFSSMSEVDTSLYAHFLFPTFNETVFRHLGPHKSVIFTSALKHNSENSRFPPSFFAHAFFFLCFLFEKFIYEDFIYMFSSSPLLPFPLVFLPLLRFKAFNHNHDMYIYKFINTAC